MKNIAFLAFGLFLLGAFIACKNTDSGIAPTVTLTSPTDGQVFLKGQTITIAGTATDDEDLHEAEIKITDKANGNNLFEEEPTVHDESTHNFSYNFTVPDITEQHEYQITVIFWDHDDNSTTKTVSVIAKPN